MAIHSGNDQEEVQHVSPNLHDEEEDRRVINGPDSEGDHQDIDVQVKNLGLQLALVDQQPSEEGAMKVHYAEEQGPALGSSDIESGFLAQGKAGLMDGSSMVAQGEKLVVVDKEGKTRK